MTSGSTVLPSIRQCSGRSVRTPAVAGSTATTGGIATTIVTLILAGTIAHQYLIRSHRTLMDRKCHCFIYCLLYCKSVIVLVKRKKNNSLDILLRINKLGLSCSELAAS